LKEIMLDLKYVSLNSFSTTQIPNAMTRKKALSIALGIALSRFVPVPSTSVEDKEAHYSSFVKETVKQMTVNFNEGIVVDVDLVLETARSFWFVRYANVNPLKNAMVVPIANCDFLTAVSGAMSYLNLDTVQFCTVNSTSVILLINRINDLISEKE
jgi:hypothetical protein